MKAPVAVCCETVAHTHASLTTTGAHTLAKAGAKNAANMQCFKIDP
jgi:hypothetical protein